MDINFLFLLPVTALLFISLVFYFALKERQEKTPSLKEKPTISMIIPVLNEINTVEGTIKSLLEANKTYKNLKEIIVVDDGSNDGTYELLQTLKSKYKILKVFQNIVKSKGKNVNFGAKYATSEIIGVIDADTFVSKNIFEKMVPYFQQKKVGSVVATVIPKNNDTWIAKYQTLEYITTSFVRRALSVMNAMYITPGGGVPLYKKEFFKELNGYCGPEILTEDMEIGVRIIKKGYKIIVSEEAKAYTRVPNSFYKFYRQRVRWYRGTIQTLKKHPDVIFSFKYGIISSFVLPLFYILIILSFFIYLSIAITLIGNLITDINRWIDLWHLGYFPKIFNFYFETNPLFLFNYNDFFVIANLFIWFLTFKEGLRISKRKINKDLVIAFLVGGIVGIFTFGFYIVSFYEEMFNKKNRWW